MDVDRRGLAEQLDARPHAAGLVQRRRTDRAARLAGLPDDDVRAVTVALPAPARPADVPTRP